MQLHKLQLLSAQLVLSATESASRLNHSQHHANDCAAQAVSHATAVNKACRPASPAYLSVWLVLLLNTSTSSHAQLPPSGATRMAARLPSSGAMKLTSSTEPSCKTQRSR